MPPFLATLLCAGGIAGLFLLDRDREARTSPALWLPIVWLALGASRNVSVWLGASSFNTSSDQYLDGSPLDRAVLSGLILASVIVLIRRGESVRECLKGNVPLVLFVVYCAASALWSDFPFVAFKRWTKLLGNVAMVLVVLTDRDPASAVRKFLTRAAILLIPSSILLIKYYPALGRIYDRWEGTAYYTGVATDKNMLGCICLVLGFGTLSRFVEIFRGTNRRSRQLLVVGTILAMDLWLFGLANSATSLGCFLIGGALIATLGLFKRERPAMVHLMVAGVTVIGIVAYVFPEAFAVLVGAMGRNTTLTGRTDIWNDVLAMDTHPWFGAGFESFFLGERLEALWSKYWWHPNEAHNGYLETYLTLGIVGLCLLANLMVTGYRNAVNVYRSDQKSGSLRLAYLVIAPIYNLTEAAFKVTNPLWILFLLVVIAVPKVQRQEEEKKNSAAEPTRGPWPSPARTNPAGPQRWQPHAPPTGPRVPFSRKPTVAHQ